MDIIEYLKQLIESYNVEDCGCNASDQNKCGFCWSFVLASGKSYNQYQPTHDTICCVHFFLDDSASSTECHYDVNTQMGQSELSYKIHKVKAYVLQYSDFQKQKGTELGYDYSESIYKEKIQPIKDCIGCSFEVDLCGYIEDNDMVCDVNGDPMPTVAYTTFSKMNHVYSKGDVNWAGIELNLTIREDFK